MMLLKLLLWQPDRAARTLVCEFCLSLTCRTVDPYELSHGFQPKLLLVVHGLKAGTLQEDDVRTEVCHSVVLLRKVLAIARDAFQRLRLATHLNTLIVKVRCIVHETALCSSNPMR